MSDRINRALICDGDDNGVRHRGGAQRVGDDEDEGEGSGAIWRGKGERDCRIAVQHHHWPVNLRPAIGDGIIIQVDTLAAIQDAGRCDRDDDRLQALKGKSRIHLS